VISFCIYSGEDQTKRIPLSYHSNMASLWFDILKVKTIRIKMIPILHIEFLNYHFEVIGDFDNVL